MAAEAAMLTKSAHTVAVEAIHLSKTYPGVRALSDLSVTFGAGEVHALVGQNGAGKSTLVRILAGAVVPDQGEVRAGGQPLHLGDPKRVAAAGIAMIHQELSVLPHLSVAANVFLGDAPSRGGFIDRPLVRARVRELCDQVGVDLEPDTPAGTLPVAAQQVVEVMRAIAQRRSAIIFDEPTTALGPRERAQLYQIVAHLKASGTAVIYISHDLEEVLAISDRVSVMRDGQLVAGAPASDWDKARLVTAMLGHSQRPQAPGRARQATTPPRLDIADLHAAHGAVGVDHLQVAAGEIVGLGGLVGSGRSELLLALAGADPSVTGTITIDGVATPCPRTVRAARRLGIALVPEDRKRMGLCLEQSAAKNVLLHDLRRANRRGLFSLRRLREQAAGPASSAGFDTRRLGAAAGTLSGGNQQKLLLARWLSAAPKVLLLDEPTQGIDIGAKDEIFATIRAMADDGAAVLLVSSDLDELVANSDRVLVVRAGTVVHELGAHPSVHEILHHAFGVEAAAEEGSPT